MRTEISNGAVPRPYAYKVLEQEEEQVWAGPGPRDPLSLCDVGGTEMARARHTH